jgi:hypothetical protein
MKRKDSKDQKNWKKKGKCGGGWNGVQKCWFIELGVDMQYLFLYGSKFVWGRW